MSSTVPTNTRNESIGMSVRADPRTPTMSTSAASAAATPHAAERQPRVMPTAKTIVSASTISTADARNAPANNRKSCTSPPAVGNVCYGAWR